LLKAGVQYANRVLYQRNKAGNRKIFARTILKAPSLPLEGEGEKGIASLPDHLEA